MFKDSYEKLADDVLGDASNYSKLFQYVHKNDIDEIRVRFALMLNELECCDNFRVYPVSMTKQYFTHADSGCCGIYNLSVKCLSKRIYWIGCNYGH